ncbi:MAG: AAA family ATPase [Actinomycetota bacterium]|nr:AAA family ATPase [Actinomycetota bacterium]
MEKVQATPTVEMPVNRDAFQALADSHKASVSRIRERNRQKRLRYLLYLNLLVFAYLIRRVIEGRPLSFGLPTIGADAWMWLLPLVLILMISVMMALPFINGRSPHIRFSPEQLGIRFSDVKGIDVVLEEVKRTLQIFLAYRSFREELGGNPRRGILFEGAPGTGKTHLAKAMACEAGVPFFFVSAPAFQSMWSGMTAWKIRAFFKHLKKAAHKEGGAIGFIEEIDAVGMSRGGVVSPSSEGTSPFSVHRFVDSGGGGMVNELLIQLQSFDTPLRAGRLKNWAIDLLNLFLPATHQMKKKRTPYNNVLIIGATNRADHLDPALIRPGRFDRTLYFDLPSRAGRRQLVDYFLARRAHAPEMDREDLRSELAGMTLGYTPAMVEHVLDEALVWALRDGRKELTWRDIQRARLSEEIGLGQPVAYTDHERGLIATHEAGHAVAAHLCGIQRKLEVLSIIKRRAALGLLAHSDLEERFTKTKSELESTLRIMLGGMAAEEIFFGESGTGPSSDLTAATTLAAQMVGSYGMGTRLISYEALSNGSHSTPNIVAKVLSQDEGREEVNELLRRIKDEVSILLRDNRDLVEALRDALLEREELLGDEILGVITAAERGRPLDPAIEESFRDL